MKFTKVWISSFVITMTLSTTGYGSIKEEFARILTLSESEKRMMLVNEPYSYENYITFALIASGVTDREIPRYKKIVDKLVFDLNSDIETKQVSSEKDILAEFILGYLHRRLFHQYFANQTKINEMLETTKATSKSLLNESNLNYLEEKQMQENLEQIKSWIEGGKLGNISEFDSTKISRAKCQRVKVSRIAEAPIAFECRRTLILQLNETRDLAIGEILYMHAREGIIDPESMNLNLSKYHIIGRLFGNLYAPIVETFTHTRLDHLEWLAKLKS